MKDMVFNYKTEKECTYAILMTLVLHIIILKLFKFLLTLLVDQGFIFFQLPYHECLKQKVLINFIVCSNSWRFTTFTIQQTSPCLTQLASLEAMEVVIITASVLVVIAKERKNFFTISTGTASHEDFAHSQISESDGAFKYSPWVDSWNSGQVSQFS